MKGYPKVVAAILNWNGIAIEYEGKPILKTCIKSLMKVDYPNLEFVFVDASSSDGSMGYVRKNFPDIPAKTALDEGSASLQNNGIKFALNKYPDAEYVLLVTNDMVFNDGLWLKKMADAAEKDGSIGMVNCRLRYPNGQIQHGGTKLSAIGVIMIKDRELSSTSRYQDIACSSLALMKKEALLKVGCFDEIYSPFSWEDIDLSSRLRRNGYKLYYVGNTNITHLESYSTLNRKVKKKWTPSDIEFCMRRNAYMCYLRYARGTLPFYFATDVLSDFVSFKNDKLAIRPNIWSRLRMQAPAIREAVNLYKKNKIMKVNGRY